MMIGRSVASILDASVETSSLTATIMGEYRAVSQPTATVDLMAGARIWSVDNDIDISLSAGGPPLAAFSGSDGSTWVDPIVGIKGRLDIDPSWYVTGWVWLAASARLPTLHGTCSGASVINGTSGCRLSPATVRWASTTKMTALSMMSSSRDRVLGAVMRF